MRRTLVEKMREVMCVVTGLAILTVIVLAIFYLPQQAWVALSYGAIACIVIPVVVIMSDFFKKEKDDFQAKQKSNAGRDELNFR